MNRIDKAFREAEGRKALLVGYATAGFPDLETSALIMKALLRHCDILELGMPFSDPVMDGPVIQESSRISLEKGTRPADVLGLARELRSVSEKPLLLMSYYNPVHRFGPEPFAREAARAGLDGVLLPDLPPEEMDEWKRAASRNGLYTILFASMTSPPKRLARLSGLAEGFVYCIAVKGTTGARDRLAPGLEEFIRRVRAACPLPLALGLGISNPEQCSRAGDLADGVVVGSALVKAATEAWRRGEDPARACGKLAERLASSLRSA